MIVREITKNMREAFRVSIEEYHGHRFVDCRVYFQDDEGTMRPTKKGVVVNDEMIDDVIEALKAARKELRANETQGR